MRERAERCREGSPGGVVEGAVLALEPAAADADALVLVHELEEPVERAGVEARVRVQREEVGRVARSDRKVRRRREAEVPPGFDKFDAGKLAHHLGRSVARVVVDDNDAQRPRRRVLTHGLETALKKPPAAVGDDPDVEPVVRVHATRAAPPIGTQSWTEMQRRIGNLS